MNRQTGLAIYTRVCHVLQIFILGVIIVGIPSSNIAMSIGGISLAALFLISPHLIDRVKWVFKTPVSILALALFIWHVIGFTWSDNLSEAIKDVRIKLPLLLFPIAIAGMYALTNRWRLILIRLYVAAVVTNTLVCYVYYLFNKDLSIHNFRDISLFISHIRLSLNICLSLVLLWSYPHILSIKYKAIIKLLLSLWLIYFLSILQSATAIFVAGLIALFFGVYFWLKLSGKWRIIAGLSVIAFIGVSGSILKAEYEAYFVPGENQQLADKKLKKYTVNGNNYAHDLQNTELENGNYVYRYICLPEIRKEWKSVSGTSVDSVIHTGYPVLSNLIRYLSSKGLRKDSIGIHALSKADVEAVLRGQTNYKLVGANGFVKRLYKLGYELNQFQANKNPGGHSLLMRLEFLKAAGYLLQNNWVFGVGTGDLKPAFSEAYKNINTQLDTRWQHRAHNQFLSIWIALGLVGVFLFVAFWSYPLMQAKKYPIYAWLAWIVITGSYFIEDTLETQAGVTFAIFFFSFFFLPGAPRDKPLK